jgi:hypothetical protein
VTAYGASTNQVGIDDVVNLHGALEHLHTVLGAAFRECVDGGAAMGLADAVRYAQLARPNPEALAAFRQGGAQRAPRLCGHNPCQPPFSAYLRPARRGPASPTRQGCRWPAVR